MGIRIDVGVETPFEAAVNDAWARHRLSELETMVGAVEQQIEALDKGRKHQREYKRKHRRDRK